MNIRYPAVILGALALAAITLPSAHAHERRFAYSYETTTLPDGSFELEQWFTWKHGTDSDKYLFRHELEYGITDRLQVGLYLFDWAIEHEGGEHKTEWEGSGVEAIYQLTDPNKSSIGSALYFEALTSDQELKLEAKLLLQKNIGPVVLAYNLIVEAEWEEEFEERVGVWEQTAGASYQISPNFMVGVEAVHELEFENWEDAGDHILSIGPNMSFRKGRFFATLAGLFQATSVDGEPDFQLRTILGVTF